MVLDLDPGGTGSFFMSAETLSAFCPQQPAPGAAKWEAEGEVGRQCGSPRESPFCVGSQSWAL